MNIWKIMADHGTAIEKLGKVNFMKKTSVRKIGLDSAEIKRLYRSMKEYGGDSRSILLTESGENIPIPDIIDFLCLISGAFVSWTLNLICREELTDENLIDQIISLCNHQPIFYYATNNYLRLLVNSDQSRDYPFGKLKDRLIEEFLKIPPVTA